MSRKTATTITISTFAISLLLQRVSGRQYLEISIAYHPEWRNGFPWMALSGDDPHITESEENRFFFFRLTACFVYSRKSCPTLATHG